MPRIIYTPSALSDIVRIAKFLSTKDRTIAKRAITIIQTEIKKVAFLPEKYRPVTDLMHHREIVINF